MRPLLAVWLIGILSLSILSATNQSPDVYHSAESAIPFDDYWKLVRDTRQAIVQMEAKPAAAIRQELDALASQWEQVTAVEYPDRSIIPVDSSYLMAELRHDPPE